MSLTALESKVQTIVMELVEAKPDSSFQDCVNEVERQLPGRFEMTSSFVGDTKITFQNTWFMWHIFSNGIAFLTEGTRKACVDRMFALMQEQQAAKLNA